MANIAEIVNQNSSIKGIDLAYEANNIPRARLGLSQVGHPCGRYLWYKHHKYIEPTPEGRVLRLFQLGNLLEDQIIKDFAMAGIIIRDQQRPVKFSWEDTILTGSIDGIIYNLTESTQQHLWECKTMNDKGFKKLLKHGYEDYNPQYKAQLHAYMFGLKLTKAFVTVYNKNTSELYQERIDLKKNWIIQKLQDVFQVIQLPYMPERHCPRQDWWEAKWCNYSKICWGN